MAPTRYNRVLVDKSDPDSKERFCTHRPKRQGDTWTWASRLLERDATTARGMTAEGTVVTTRANDWLSP